MMGKHHVMVNTGILGAGLISFAAVHFSGLSFPAGKIVVSVHTVRRSLYLLFLYAIFVTGSLFPDIDSSKSVLGRYIYLPFKHRTWTHSLFFLLLLFPLVLTGVPGFLFFTGYVLHLLADSCSAGGICWLYPFVRFREYSSGAKVAPGHHIKLYYTGKLSEQWFVAFLLCSAVIVAIFAGVKGHGFRVLYLFLRHYLFSG